MQFLTSLAQCELFLLLQFNVLSALCKQTENKCLNLQRRENPEWPCAGRNANTQTHCFFGAEAAVKLTAVSINRTIVTKHE